MSMDRWWVPAVCALAITAGWTVSASASISRPGASTARKARRCRLPSRARHHVRRCVPPRHAFADVRAPGGHVSLATAEQAFVATVGPLPGVRARGFAPRVRSGSGPVRWLLRYRSRLTARQRSAVLRLVHGPLGGSTGRAATAELDKWKGLLNEAAGREAAHLGRPLGLTVEVELVDKQPVDKKTKLPATTLASTGAFDAAGGITGAAATCRFRIFPKGRAVGLNAARETAAHEVFHCFQAAIMGLGAYYGVSENWLDEGSAEWVGVRIAEEWSGVKLHDSWWNSYLEHPEIAVLNQSYSATGFWAHLAESGLDPFTVLPTLLVNPNNFDAYKQAIGLAGTGFLNTWASGHARRPGFGSAWDTTGAGITSARYEPPFSFLTNGGEVAIAAPTEARAVEAVDLDADVVDLVPSGAGPVYGRLHPAKGADRPLAGGSYCVRKGGCGCPAGSAGAGTTLPSLPAGETWFSLANRSSAKRVTIRALALKDHCKRKGAKRTINIGGEIGGAFTDLGTCGLNAFGAYQAVFDTTIGDKVYLLQIYIPKASWAGPGSYPLKRGKVFSEPNVTLSDGHGNSWDSAEGSESSSGQVVINGDFVSGSVSASMLRPGGIGTEVADGSFVCSPG